MLYLSCVNPMPALASMDRGSSARIDNVWAGRAELRKCHVIFEKVSRDLRPQSVSGSAALQEDQELEALKRRDRAEREEAKRKRLEQVASSYLSGLLSLYKRAAAPHLFEKGNVSI